jgi:hypothetical protein
MPYEREGGMSEGTYVEEGEHFHILILDLHMGIRTPIRIMCIITHLFNKKRLNIF